MDLQFTLDEATGVVRSSHDPSIFIRHIGTSRERRYFYCLNWQERRIVYVATVVEASVSGIEKHEWTVQTINGLNPFGVPEHVFSSDNETAVALDLIVEAMSKRPIYTSNRPEKLTITARLSDALSAVRASLST